MDITRKYASDKELEYLKNKRKELHLTQNDFAELFDMSGGTYRKYETSQRRLDMNLFRMMKVIIEYYEATEKSINSISISNYLEHLRESSLIAIFNKGQHDVVNIIFDFIIRNVRKNFD